MNSRFSFNYEEYDFWPLYDAIKIYYPIGVKKHQEFDIYRQYPGIQKLEKLLFKKIAVKETYQNNWVSFTKRVGDEFGKTTQGTTFGLMPSYSAYVILDANGSGNKWNYKELHFSVSLLGKFFQVYGLEKSIRSSVMNHEGEELTYQMVNLKNIVVSPHGEYKSYFERIERYITEEFKEYRLVPFKVGQTIINGLEIYHLEKENCSINMAIFNDFLGMGEEINEMKAQGDIEYGIKSWKK